MTNYYLLFGFGIVGLFIVPLAHAQVGVKQSTTVNGQKVSIPTNIGNPGVWNFTTLPDRHTIAMTWDFNSEMVMIKYCGPQDPTLYLSQPLDCHLYSISKNGTINEVK